MTIVPDNPRIEPIDQGQNNSEPNTNSESANKQEALVSKLLERYFNELYDPTEKDDYIFQNKSNRKKFLFRQRKYYDHSKSFNPYLLKIYNARKAKKLETKKNPDQNNPDQDVMIHNYLVHSSCPRWYGNMLGDFFVEGREMSQVEAEVKATRFANRRSGSSSCKVHLMDVFVKTIKPKDYYTKPEWKKDSARWLNKTSIEDKLKKAYAEARGRASNQAT